MKTSLIITTYDWPEALNLVLQSVENQRVLPNEVIIADDGSDERTTKVIEYYKKKIKLKHVWQKNNGFQKAMILNKSICQASGDYIIQIDGDIILHKKFIQDHLYHSKKNINLINVNT